MRLLQGHDGSVRALAYSPDGSTLAVGGDQAVGLWDAATNEVRAVSPERSPFIRSVAFHPDGRSFISGDWGGNVEVRDAATAGVRSRFAPRHVRAVTALVFLARGRYLVSVAGNARVHRELYRGRAGRVVVHDLESGRFLPLSGFEVVWGLATDDAGRSLFFGTGDRYLMTWRLGEERFEAWTEKRDHPSQPSNVPFAMVAKEKPRYFARSRPRAPAEPRTLAVSPDGRTLAAPWDRLVEIWDVAEARLRATLRADDDDVVSALAFGPDGRTLASASRDGTVRLWDADEARPLSCHDWGIGPVHCLAFAPDGMTIAAGGDSGLVVWDVDAPGY